MKHSFLMILIGIQVLISGASSCDNEDDNSNIENNTPMANGKIKITVNSQTFSATLLDNNSAKAFKEMLPMTIKMTELNSNEKYYQLPQNLPTNPANPGTIKIGDLMLYGSNTLVLFYKSFTTSYSYTNIGSIANPNGLEEAMGSGNVSVTYDIDLN